MDKIKFDKGDTFIYRFKINNLKPVCCFCGINKDKFYFTIVNSINNTTAMKMLKLENKGVIARILLLERNRRSYSENIIIRKK